jgi:2-dehydro-3-deoxygalactonokinase
VLCDWGSSRLRAYLQVVQVGDEIVACCEGPGIGALAGIRAANAAGVPDVMRGEETQVFGAIDRQVSLARGRHTLLLPGTHSKWVQITEGRIATVQTYVTGELFAVLRSTPRCFAPAIQVNHPVTALPPALRARATRILRVLCSKRARRN